MSFEPVCRQLVGDSPGRITELNYFRVGADSAGRKVYLQAAVHADEQPGILVLHYLLQMLREADEKGELNAQFVLFPMVNPLGMGDIEFNRHQGRYNRSSGVNHNRNWPSLYPAVDATVIEKLGGDGAQNIALIRTALRQWAAELPQLTAFQQWQKTLYQEACDADYVFDLHCDDDSLLHIFSVPQQRDRIHRLADWTGAAATMLEEDSGGGSFDEVWPAIWLQIAREYPERPIPLPVISCTLEYRGQLDTFEALNRVDAEQLYGYFQEEGLIAGDLRGVKGEAAEPTDLRATEYIKAPKAGLLIYKVELGDRVSRGDLIAELLQLDGEGAFTESLPLLAGTDGLVLSRMTTKYVWRNANVCKIVGSEILESREGKLLSD